MKATYQTRIVAYDGVDRSVGDAALSACAALNGRVQRNLFAEMAAGRSAASLKSAYLERFGIPARLFNALRVSLQGKVASVREGQRLGVDDLRRRVARAKKRIATVRKDRRPDQAHHKRRRLANLKHRLKVLETERKAGLVRLCFGSRRLWHKQYDLEANSYASHEEWLEDWREARSSELFVLGSRDETAGCQLCQASIAQDGSLTLTLRMPDSVADRHGKYVTVSGLRFAYGHEQVLAALASNADYAACRREGGSGDRPGAGNQLPVQARRQGLACLRRRWPRIRSGRFGTPLPKNLSSRRRPLDFTAHPDPQLPPSFCTPPIGA